MKETVPDGQESRTDSRESSGSGALPTAAGRRFRSFWTAVFQTRADSVFLGTLLVLALYRIYRPLGNRSLHAWDEGIYANAAKHAVTEGYWLIPRTTGFFTYGPGYQPFLEKPPLVFWLQALSMEVFGVTNFAARFQSATFAVLTAVVIYVAGRDVADRRAGFLGGVVYLTTPAVVRGTSSATEGGTDMAVIFFGTLMTYLVWRAVREDDPRWLVYASLPAVGAVLSKGFDAGVWVFVVVPLLLLSPWLLFGRDMTKAVGVTVALCAPWPVYAWSQYGHEFVEIIFVEQVWNRIGGETGGPLHDVSPVFEFMQYPYFREYPFGFDPWVYLLVPAVVYLVASAWRRDRWSGRADVAFVVWWFVCILGFYLWTGNLWGYVLKTFAPAAILVGWFLSEVSRGRAYSRVAAVGGVAGMLAFSPRTDELSPVTYSLDGAPMGIPGEPLVGTEFVVVAVISLFAVVVYADLAGLVRSAVAPDEDGRRVSPRHVRLAGAVLAAGFVLVVAVHLGSPGLAPHTSPHEELGGVIDEETPENTPVYATGGAEQAFSNYASVGFYTDRELRGGYYRDWELARGDHLSPDDVEYLIATGSEVEEGDLGFGIDRSEYEIEVLYRYENRYWRGGQEMTFVRVQPRSG